MSDMSEWLTMAQAADRLGVSPPTLRRWADQGRIPVHRTLGGHRRIPLSELPRIAPLEVPPRPRPGEQPSRRAEELPRGRAEVDDDSAALRRELDELRAERDRLRERLGEEQAATERAVREAAFLRRQLAEASRAQAELRQVILRLVDGGAPPGEPSPTH